MASALQIADDRSSLGEDRANLRDECAHDGSGGGDADFHVFADGFEDREKAHGPQCITNRAFGTDLTFYVLEA